MEHKLHYQVFKVGILWKKAEEKRNSINYILFTQHYKDSFVNPKDCDHIFSHKKVVDILKTLSRRNVLTVEVVYEKTKPNKMVLVKQLFRTSYNKTQDIVIVLDHRDYNTTKVVTAWLIDKSNTHQNNTHEQYIQNEREFLESIK